jgi:PEP-CTERM motif
LKRSLVVIFAALALGSVAGATTMQCGPVQTLFVNGNAPTQGSSTCAVIDAGAGNMITSISLILAYDAQFVLVAPAHETITFTPGGAGAGFGVNTVVLDGTVQFGGLNGTPVSPFTVTTVLNPNTQTFASFTTLIDAVVTAGGIDSSSARVLVSYEVAPVPPPPTGTPEPSTFVLLGSALTGLGVSARRRKA